MKTLCKLLVLCLACSLLFAGCKKEQAKPPAEPDYNKLIQPAVDVSISDYLPVETLSRIMGCPMQLLGVYEDNTQAIYTSEDSHQVTVLMKNQTLTGFEAEKNNSSFQITTQDGVGEAAYWGENDTGDIWLVFYSGGYAVTVSVMCAETDDQAHGMYTRQIAEAILEKLPQGTTD